MIRKFILSIIFLGIISACDDGDVIVSTFDFSAETQLQLCGANNTKVIYGINNDPNESLSLNFEDDDFDGTFDSIPNPEPRTILLNNTNKLIYRSYNGQISGATYFCNEIPPSSPKVVDEYISTSGGSVVLTSTVTSQDDNDGVAAELEDLNGNGDYFDDDSDGDGIPNFIDPDDDNDNVPTSVEIAVQDDDAEPDSFPDTDNDGIPNYLDEDDDGDGTITRYEDLNANDDVNEDGLPDLNPGDDDTDGDNIPNYLDTDNDELLQIDAFKEYTISRSFRTLLVAKNVTLNNSYSEENITFETLVMGYLDVTASDTLKVD
ncbi:MAG TPA: hypothetical protein VFM82_07210 [Flavobacteriaceae bacterium]|nr:hypothetical protein [Flavobacteriaceae bacterium]